MREIPLTRGLVALVDDEDYEELSRFKWQANAEGYAVRKVRLPGEGPRKLKDVRMHRFLLGLQPGDPRQGDHVDLNRLNNQRGNLRIATHAENVQNHGRGRNNKSGFKGVYWRKKERRWHARIMYKSQRRGLGYYETAEEAYAAYCKAALELHGEFANLGVKAA